jgi:hypothetical protein
MMGMTPGLILGYLHHDRASQATEQLLALEVVSLPYAKPVDQARELARLRRAADGESRQTPAEAAAQQKALWDGEWARLRGRLGSTGRLQEHGRLQPGERFVSPEV